MKYAKVCKKRRIRRVLELEMVQDIILGDPSEVMKPLGLYFEGSIDTAYLEKLILTIRNSLARFVRKTMDYGKIPMIYSHALGCYQTILDFSGVIEIQDYCSIQ